MLFYPVAERPKTDEITPHTVTNIFIMAINIARENKKRQNETINSQRKIIKKRYMPLPVRFQPK